MGDRSLTSRILKKHTSKYYDENSMECNEDAAKHNKKILKLCQEMVFDIEGNKPSYFNN